MLSVFDLDDTVMTARRSPAGPYDSAVIEVPNPPVLELLNQRLQDPERTVIVVTGRRERWRGQTLSWFGRYVTGRPQQMYFCGDHIRGWRVGKIAAFAHAIQLDDFCGIEVLDDDRPLLLDYGRVSRAMLGALVPISLNHVQGELITPVRPEAE